MPKINKKLEEQRRPKKFKLFQEEDTVYTAILRPFRVFQFILSTFLFFLTIYVVWIPGPPLATMTCLSLIIINGIYAFVMSLEIISQYSERSLRVTPMFTFSFLGFLIYFLVSLFLLLLADTASSFSPIKSTMIFFSFVLSLFFLIDILIVLSIWKNKCKMCQKSCQEKESFPAEIIASQTLSRELKKRDATTSISAIKLSLNDHPTPDHGLRKMAVGRRREYADRPTSVPSIATVKIAAIQTNPKQVSVEESQQTCKSELKEVLVQTMSRCEFCNQQLQTQGILTSSQLSAQCTPCSAIIQLIRGAVAMPCCPNCNCKPEQIEQKEHAGQIENTDQNENFSSRFQDENTDSKEQTMEKQIQTGENEVLTTEHEVQTIENPLQTVDNIRDHSKNNENRVLTNFTKMTKVTVHCTTPGTTMEVVSSTGSKENIVTTYIPPHGSPVILCNNEKSQNATHMAVCQQTENPMAMLYSKEENEVGQIREIESSKSISGSGSLELEKSNNENEKVKNPLQIKDDKETTDKKTDVKEVRTGQASSSRTPKSDTNDNPTNKGRKSKEQSTSSKPNKKVKKAVTTQKEKKDDNRTYSRFLPLEDVKLRDSKEVKNNEQEYIPTFCMPVIPHEIVEHPPYIRTRTISSVFQRNNRIDPIYTPECETYIATQIEEPFVQGEIDPSEELFTTPPITTMTNIAICTKCKKEKVVNITNRSEDISQKRFNSRNTNNEHDEILTYCTKCGQLQS